MVIKFVATCDGVSRHGEEFAWAFEDFGDGIDESLVISRPMPFDRRKDRRYDIRRVALLGKKNLNARACGLRRLDKDESVLVRNDHGAQAASLLFSAACRKLSRQQVADTGGYYGLRERFGEGAETCTRAACAPQHSRN
jgi:hypothetical protein